MARARNIKPGLFTNDILAECEPLARILFTGLWTIADREGRLEDRPRRIKAEILPYDDVDCDNLLSQLAEKGFIIRYLAGGDRFIQVTNFDKHQNPHQKEAASEIPAPDLTGASTVQEQEVHTENPADSLNLIPDTPIRIPDTPSPQPRKRDSSAKPTGGGEADSRFQEFWQAYPRKAGKQAAIKAFRNVKWREVEFASLMSALDRQKQSEQWQKDGGQFIPHPATWLNQGRWDDELPAAKPEQPPPGHIQSYSRNQDEAEQQMRRDLEAMQQAARRTA